MYFSVSSDPSLLYHQKLPSGHWLNTMLPQTSYGYQLDNYGGNYINFSVDSTQLIVNFSYFKDFDIGSNSKQGILLTNIDSLIDQPLSPMIVKAQVDNCGLTTQSYNTRAWLMSQYQSVDSTVTQLKECLWKNLKKCLELSSTNWIVFTGGLDSSLLAFLAWHNRCAFNALVSEEFKNFWDLPFNTHYAKLQSHPEGIEHHTIKSSFYQPEYNYSITGFFGDTTMLHHGSMYYQSKHLASPLTEDQLYDSADTNLPLFDSEIALRTSIVKLSLSTKFRHWFPNFEILDPYRSPLLLDVIMKMSCQDLVHQLGSGILQKTIIEDLDPLNLNYICRRKNDYTQFQR